MSSRQGICGAPTVEAKYVLTTRHSLKQGDPESFARRRHDKQVGHAIELTKNLQRGSTEETYALAYPHITRKRFESGAIVPLTDNQILHIVALRDDIGDGRNDSVLAFVLLARVHPSDSQEHALVLDSQSSVRCPVVSKRER